MNRLRLLSVFLALSLCAKAQQLSLFTQYREYSTVINPAAMESDFLAFGQNLVFGGSYRAQWTGIDGGPNTQVLRGSYFMDDYSGVTLAFGGYLINDQTGPTGFTGIYGRVAGVLTSDAEYSGLSLGLTAGAVQYRVNGEKIELRDDGDAVGDERYTQWHPDLGVGLYYYQMLGGNWDGDYIYAGVSVPQLIGLDLQFQNEDGEFAVKRIQHIYANFGFYKFFEGFSFLEPSIWVKYAPGAPIDADINLRYHLPAALWIGAGASTQGNFHFETGLTLGDQVGLSNIFKVGYGFDYSFSSFGPFVGSTHEFNISIAFDR